MSTLAGVLLPALLRRDAEDPDGNDEDATQKEIFASWSLFILIMLLIMALMTSYFLQTRRVQAVHETVISIFAGMFVGLVLRLTASHSVLGAVSFDYKFFFNLLLPPIIIASGFELRLDNFFRKIGTILTFAFAGTFISALVLAVILYCWTRLPIDSAVNLTFVDAMSVGATLSATDPVTILAIFNTYKVDPKLYTVIFGESILNDAVAIVLFETAQKYRSGADRLTVFSFFESIGVFLFVFFGSLVIGLVIGFMASMLLKFTMLRRYPKIESCVIVLIAYASYFFATAIHMSGIVALLFCGICLKRYAYLNMSRRTQLTCKFVFQLTSQLSENFIFIYLGLSLFTDTQLDFQPGFILVSVLGICVARWCAVFPISRLINWTIKRSRKRTNSIDTADPLPASYQMMLFWAGLRGAVGVALAAGLTGPNGMVLRATVLVVVVLTVIIFGGTTASMLEILDIRTGVTEQVDSDDEFDLEVAGLGGGGRHHGYGGYGEFDGEAALPLNDRRRSPSSSGSRQRGGGGGGGGGGSSFGPRPGSSSSRGVGGGLGGAQGSSSSTSLSRPGGMGLHSQHHSAVLDGDDGLGRDLGLPPPPNRRSTLPSSVGGFGGAGGGGLGPVGGGGAHGALDGDDPEHESAILGQLKRLDAKLKPVLLVGLPEGGGAGSGGGFGHGGGHLGSAADGSAGQGR